MNVGSILDLIAGALPRITGAVNAAQPVAQSVVADAQTAVGHVETLVGIGKDLFQGKAPTPEQLAAAEKIRHDLAQQIADA